MRALAVTAIGTDQPGIVAAVTGVLVEHGCNLEDTSMSILGGHFAMVMIVETPSAVTPAALEADLADATRALELLIAVRTVEPLHATAAETGAPGWTIVVYGADHPGIVYGMTKRLAELGVNIVDLQTRVTPDDPPIYMMVMEVTLPSELTPAQLESSMEVAANELGVTCTLHSSEADIL